MKPLASCEWERNLVEQIIRDHHHSEFPNDNQTTYFLWMRGQYRGTNRQRSATFWISQCHSDHLQAMDESNVIEQTSRNQHHSKFPSEINLLTSYKSKSNSIEQTGRYQHDSESSNDNQTTYFLWVREQQNETDRQRSISSSIPKWQSDYLLPINESTICWNRQSKTSTISNSPMTIRSLTSYEWYGNSVEQTGRD